MLPSVINSCEPLICFIHIPTYLEDSTYKFNPVLYH